MAYSFMIKSTVQFMEQDRTEYRIFLLLNDLAPPPPLPASCTLCTGIELYLYTEKRKTTRQGRENLSLVYRLCLLTGEGGGGGQLKKC